VSGAWLSFGSEKRARKGVVPTPDPGRFGGAGEGRAGFAGYRRWDMEDREWSCFKLKRQLKGLNLKK
jgi:hypothetical protein